MPNRAEVESHPVNRCLSPYASALRALTPLIALLLSNGAAGASPLFAERLTAENIELRAPRGPDAIAGVGDWVIGNGVLCAAISAPEHESTLSSRGGLLIDLAHCDLADDQWAVLQPVMNLSRDHVLPVDSVRAERDTGSVSVITEGELEGLHFTSRYRLDLEQPERLQFETRVRRVGEGDAMFLFGDVALHGNRQLSPFTLDSAKPSRSPGFDHPEVDLDSPLSMARALVRADTQVLVGGAQLDPGISYGWRIQEAYRVDAKGQRESVAHIALNGKHFSILGFYTDTLFWGGTGDPGLLELAQTLLMDLEAGEELVLQREILVGRQSDVASVTNSLWATGPRIEGGGLDPDDGLHVLDENGTTLTFVRPDSDGRFAFHLPLDATPPLWLQIHRGSEKLPRMPLVLNAKPGSVTQLPPMPASPLGELALPQGQPMRLIFEGVPPTPDPLFQPDGYDFTVGSETVSSSTPSREIPLAGVARDPTAVRLLPGRYRVLATRGPEWTVSETTVQVIAGERSRLELDPLVRVFEVEDEISADFHVHAAPSNDSTLPIESQVAAFVAMGTEVLVSTEHDLVFDYGPTVESMGLSSDVITITGSEITSSSTGPRTPFTSGHANAFPLIADPLAYRGGSPSAERRRLREVLADLRTRPEAPILQLNHPRESGLDQGLGSYLTHLAVSGEGFEPSLPLDAEPNQALSARDPESGLRDFDFDAIELLNHTSMDAYRLTRADWFSWLLQGERRTATANSDSHSASHPVGLPRNYVAYKRKAGQSFDPSTFIEAVRAGRVTGSSGPWLRVRLEEAGPGDTHVGDRAELFVEVKRADWVPAHEVRVYVNGHLRARETLPAKGQWHRPFQFSQDSFITVEVEGWSEPASIYARVVPGYTPFAFSNPIFVDADGLAGWTPPGLAEPLPDTITAPLATP